MTPAWTRGEVPEGVDPLVHFRLVEMAEFHEVPRGERALWTVQATLEPGLEAGAAAEALRVLAREVGANGGQVLDPSRRAARSDTGPDLRTGRPRTLTLLADRACVERLFAERRRLRLAHVLLGRIVPPEVRGGAAAGPTPEGPAAGGRQRQRRAPKELPVVVAVIDDGIALAHENFRRADGGSRVAYAWLQDGTPPNMPIGRELDRAEIERLLRRHTRAGALDEAGFYREAGLLDFATPQHKPVAFRTSHGTHVAGLAGGFAPGQMDDARPLIFVQLSSQTVEDTSGGRIEPELGLAIDYVLDRARRISEAAGLGVELPVVVNFSFGNFAGSHDGTDLVERLLDGHIPFAHGGSPEGPPGGQGQPVRVVLPAGNGNLARCHARFDFRPDDDEPGAWRELEWHVLPDDRTASYLEIWLPLRPEGEPPAREVELELVAPNGRDRVALTRGDPAKVRDLCLDGRTVARLDYRFVPAPTARGCFTLALLPTAHERARPLAPSGRWRIRLRSRGLGRTQPESVHLRIQRDESLANRPRRGRQSFFDHPDYRRFDRFGAVLAEDPAQDLAGTDCPVTRTGTLNAFATGRRTLVIGGGVRSTGQVARYSGAGPAQSNAAPGDPGPRPGPDAVAPSEDSPLLAGVLGAGSRGGTRVRLNGTSVATPQVARWVAEALARGDASDAGELAQQAVPLAVRDETGTPRPLPNARQGAGLFTQDGS